MTRRGFLILCAGVLVACPLWATDPKRPHEERLEKETAGQGVSLPRVDSLRGAAATEVEPTADSPSDVSLQSLLEKTPGIFTEKIRPYLGIISQFRLEETAKIFHQELKPFESPKILIRGLFPFLHYQDSISLAATSPYHRGAVSFYQAQKDPRCSWEIICRGGPDFQESLLARGVDALPERLSAWNQNCFSSVSFKSWCRGFLKDLQGKGLSHDFLPDSPMG